MQLVAQTAAMHDEITDDFGCGKGRAGFDTDPTGIAQQPAVAAKLAKQRQFVAG